MNPIPKRLKLPVHLVNGRWEFFYGGAIPLPASRGQGWGCTCHVAQFKG